ncbi:UPF0746 protein [Gossypium australe]|uniref:UPF0746 protein n=1 Tax=Gossypium australe TaxID=47621 RepID=A0A5B6VNA0_9ROSI|nr:UPF0746 protein [Gossypium australe]
MIPNPLLDFEEDWEIPNLLGTTFLATSKSAIDLEQNELTTKIDDEIEVFKCEEKKKRDDEEFIDFLKMFKPLNVNLPLLELLEKMPKYAKFLKDRRIWRREQIALNKECSAESSKLKDPDSFTIPIEIGGVSFGKAPCDLGASINLMPLPIYRRFGLGDLKKTEAD